MYSSGDKSASFLASTKAAREERHKEKARTEAANRIAAFHRGNDTRTKLRQEVRKDIQELGKKLG